MAYKERTEERLAKTDELEKTLADMTLLQSIEGATKEAIYALDDTTPFRIFDCLVPEL